MDRYKVRSNVGIGAGLRFFIPAFVGAILGFIGIFVLAFARINPFNSYVYGFAIGAIVGVILAAMYLKKNNVPHYLLISILSMLFGIFIPAFGGLVAFPLITSLLGKNR